MTLRAQLIREKDVVFDIGRSIKQIALCFASFVGARRRKLSSKQYHRFVSSRKR